MKRDSIKKYLYAIISLFLLCNFFQIGKDESNNLDYSLNQAEVIAVHVPNGVHMEIKSEKTSADVLIKTKPITIKSILSLRYILVAVLIAIAGIIYSCGHLFILRAKRIYSRCLVIQYIHNKDGRKRL